MVDVLSLLSFIPVRPKNLSQFLVKGSLFQDEEMLRVDGVYSTSVGVGYAEVLPRSVLNFTR